MAKLRLQIGAVVDASVSTAFTSVEKSAQRAGAVIRKQLGDASAEAMRKAAAEASKGAGPYRKIGDEAAAAGAKVKRAMAELDASMGAGADGARQRFAALHNDLAKLPVDMRLVAKEAQKAFQQVERMKAREMLGLGSSTSRGGGGGGGFGGRNSIYWHPASWLTIRKPNIETINVDPLGMAGRFGMGAAAYAGRAAMGLARGAGIDTSFESLVAKNVNEEKIAQQIANSGYMPGMAGPNGKIVARQSLLAETRQTGMETGTERGELLEGMQKFVGLTGDLNLARGLMGDLAKLSRATGASFADVASSSAEVANVLGDIPDKGHATLAIMQQIAGQGKLGAVEVRDLATQMAKIATQAVKFKGGAAENIALLGVVAQEAKGRGGATNAAQATTAVARFADQLTQKTVIRKMDAAGINVFADKGHTQLKQAPEVIKAILSYTKGDLGKLSGLMQSSIARKAIGGFADIYSKTNGTDEQKIAAVTAEFSRLQSAQLTTEEVTRAFGESMETSEARAKVFNEKMAEVADGIRGQLGPALFTYLLPAIEGAGRSLDKWLGKLPSDALKSFGDTLGHAFKSLAGTESVKTNEDKIADKNVDAQTQAANDASKTLRWMSSHLVTNAEGPVDVDANKAAAKPILDKLAQDDARLTMQAGDLRERVESEGKNLRGNMGRYGLSGSDEDIRKLAGMRGAGGDAATKYLQDKQELQSLQDQMQHLEALRVQLAMVISNGAVTVRMDTPPPPAGGGGAGGVQPPNSSH